MKKLSLILLLALLLVALTAGLALADGESSVVVGPATPVDPDDDSPYHVGNVGIRTNADKSGPGWTWDGVDRILTLDGFRFSDELDNFPAWDEAICVPKRTTIILKGHNEIDRSGDHRDYPIAIACHPDDPGPDDSLKLTILGPGSLSAVVSGTGVEAYGLLIDEEAELNITLKPALFDPAGEGPDKKIILAEETKSDAFARIKIKISDLYGLAVPSFYNEPADLVIRDSRVNILCDGSLYAAQLLKLREAMENVKFDSKWFSPTVEMFGILCEGTISIDNSEVDIDLTDIEDAHSFGIWGYVAPEEGDFGISIDSSRVSAKANDIGIMAIYGGYNEEGGGVSIVDSTVFALVQRTIPASELDTLVDNILGDYGPGYDPKGRASGYDGPSGFGIYSEADIFIDNSYVDALGYFAGIIINGQRYGGDYDIGAVDGISFDGHTLTAGAVYGYDDIDWDSDAQIDLERVIVIKGGEVVDIYSDTDYNMVALDAPVAPLLYGASDGVFGIRTPASGTYRIGASFSSTADPIHFNEATGDLFAEGDAIVARYADKPKTEEEYQNLRDELNKLVRSFYSEMTGDFSQDVQIRPIQEIAQMMLPILGGVGKNFPFIDVGLEHWARGYVEQGWKSGLINGKTEVLYLPDGPLTYAEAIKLAACIHQLNSMGAVSFEASDPWYQTYVSYAELNQIIQPGEFAGQYNDAIIRYDFAHIFGQALPLSAFTPLNAIDSIPDVPSSNRHADEILMLYRAGILVGSDAAGTFNGNSNIKRSEVAAIVVRMIDPDKRIKK